MTSFDHLVSTWLGLVLVVLGGVAIFAHETIGEMHSDAGRPSRAFRVTGVVLPAVVIAVVAAITIYRFHRLA